MRAGERTAYEVPACIDIFDDAEDADGVVETAGGSSSVLVIDVSPGRVPEQLVWFTMGMI